MSLSASDVAAASRALAEGATFRAVRRANLVLPDREAEFAIRSALEDALRIADFSDAGRLIVVRRLALRDLPRGATGPQIARVLERAWQLLAPSAVAFDAPEAQHADIVYFRSLNEARLAWLQRFVAHGAPTEWFWSHALPELADQTVPVTLVSVLSAMQSTASGALAEAILALPQAGVHRLLDALPATRVDAMLAPELAWPIAKLPARQEHADRIDVAPIGVLSTEGRPARHDAQAAQPPAAIELAAPFLRDAVPGERFGVLFSAFDAADWRLAWFTAQVIRAATGKPASAQALAALITVEAPSTDSAATTSTDNATTASAGSTTSSPPSRHDGALVGPESSTAAVPRRRDVSARVEDGLLSHALPPKAARRQFGAGYPWLDDNRPTAFGGLLMLLNTIELLRFPAWLNAQPAAVRAYFGRALLARIARRLRVPRDDPQQALLVLDHPAQAGLLETSCQWQDFSWPRGFDAKGIQPADSAISADESLRHWQRALVRLLRRYAGVGIARLVSRPAGVSITPTHVDVVLPLADADTALRRVGLDRDPGWVPWFGWIVAFHYIEDRRHAAG